MVKISSILKSKPEVMNTIKVLKVIKEPYRYQVAVISKQATTKPAPQTYNVKIECSDEKIKPTSSIKGYCDCHDFRYRQAYCWYQRGALLMPPSFVLLPPDKTNPNCKEVRACKHISAVINYLIKKNI